MLMKTTVTMSETGEPIKITWEVALTQFENLVKFAARQQAVKGIDSMMSAEDLYQEGMIKLYTCWKKWCVKANKDMDEFGPIFKKSLFRVVKVRQANVPYFIDLEDALDNVADENSEDVVDNLYREAGLEQLSNLLENMNAKNLLRELIEPSDETMFQVYADIKRKEMLKSQGKRVNVPKDTTIRMKHIIRALDITTKQYDMAMIEIRQKARTVLTY